MTFSDTISWYYLTESKHGFSNSTLPGLLMLIIALLGWWLAEPASLLNGVSIAVSVGSLIFVLGGALAGNNARNTLPEKVEYFRTNPTAFLEDESKKVEEIHSSWFGVRVFWSLFLLTSVVMLFLVATPFGSGLAVGILIIGTVGHIEEVISYQHNEAYRLAVLKQAS